MAPARPVLSAVLSTHDRAELLRAALERLGGQTLAREAFEVVIVDDGSTDGTREVVRAFEGRLPLRYAHQRSAGLTSARNHGAFSSRGDLVLFLEDDDLAEPGLLEAHVATHRRRPDPAVAVLGRTRLDPSVADDPLVRFVTEVGSFLLSSPRLKSAVPRDLGHFWGGRASYKRSFLLDHGVFDPAFRFGSERVELAYRLSRHGLRVLHEPRAVSTTVRRLDVDELCGELYERGRASVRFARLHPGAEVERRADVEEAREEWRRLEPEQDAILRSARELDRLARTRRLEGLPLDDLARSLLHRSYGAAFRTAEVKGIVDAAGDAPAAGRARPPASRDDAH